MFARIDHPVLGSYEQHIFDDVADSAHDRPAPRGRFSPDILSSNLTKNLTGKCLLDLGFGLESSIIISAINANASSVFALSTQVLQDARSRMVEAARGRGHKSLNCAIVPEDWWSSEPALRPTIGALLQLPEGDLPSENSLDIMTTLQVLNFASPDAMINVLDLASMLLKRFGKFVATNVSPYTGVIYDYDDGRTLARIIAGNAKYRLTEEDMPTGFFTRRNEIGAYLMELSDKPAFARTFLCFDDDTIYGIYNAWAKSRWRRGLPADLLIERSYYFSPQRIAQPNKLTTSEHVEKENHYFSMVKV